VTIALRAFVPPPFRLRSFRFQFAGDLLTSVAFEMENLILSWYILVQTGSVVLLTLFGSLQFIGTLAAPAFGLGAERFGTRNLLSGMRASYSLVACAQLGFAASGALSAETVIVLATLTGLVRPSDMTMRNLLISETVGQEHMMSALSISRMTQDAARIAGAMAGAATFALLGMVWAYVAVTLFYAAASACASRAAAPMRRVEARTTPLRDLREGVAHVWATPVLLAAMLLAFLVNLLAYPLSGGLLAYIARDVYGTGQAGLAQLSAGFAVGGLAGSFVLSFTGRAAHPARIMLVGTVLWYVALMGFSHSTAPLEGVVLLAVAGFVQNLSMVPMSLLILRASAERLRGRVMGVRMMCVYGLPVGLLVAGWLIAPLGFAGTGALYCALGLATTLAIAARWREALWH
jgi:Na+/melibiose symporter-like transporter